MAVIYCEPAECVSDCHDPLCPYIHIETWHRKGDPSDYPTLAAALAVDNAAEDQAIIQCGDDLTDAMLGDLTKYDR